MPHTAMEVQSYTVPSDIKEKYFSPKKDRLVARLVTDPEMIMAANQRVTETYKKHGYLVDQRILTIPPDINPLDLFKAASSESLLTTLIDAQFGPDGIADFINGHVFVAQTQGDKPELIGMLDIHTQHQRTYIVTGNDEILYSVRIIPKVEPRELPIQKLTHKGDLLQAKGMNEKEIAEKKIPALVVSDHFEPDTLLKLIPNATTSEILPLLDNESPRQTVDNLQVELSQLAVCAPPEKHIPNAFEELFAVLFLEEGELGISRFGGVFDFGALVLKNNLRHNPNFPCFGIIPLAAKTHYMGSDVVPILIDRDHSIESVRKTHPEIASILEAYIPQQAYLTEFAQAV